MARKEFFDIPKKLYINEQLSDWADLFCEEKSMSFAGYVRWLITEHKERVENELSKQIQIDNSPKEDPVFPHPNGLYTADQVAHLINALTGKKS